MKAIKFFLVLVLAVATVSLGAEAHKKFYNTAPIYEQNHERCICDCAHPQPVLPNKPYFGSGGYHQPRPSGYGNAGAYAVAGSYGSGAGQASGGY